jgi:wyosine [tRNA(Phe)-imidazoG37] synthetase (radical SAM superfamily)
MMLLRPQRGIVYGPVRSRRLGASLGINVLPVSHKVCSFDCVYCQYGWTDAAQLASLARGELPAVDIVLEAVEAALRALPAPPAYLTFSGNGEATLHPDFGALVDGVTKLRDALTPQARTAILSNAARVTDPGVRAALARLDEPILKLDAGTDATLQQTNRPVVPLTVEDIVTGLCALPRVTLQSLFCGGPDGNLGPGNVAAWLAAVERIRPVAVQIYTLDRGYPSDRIEVASPAELAALGAAVRARGIAAQIF